MIRKVVVGISGGVDSAVAGFMLKQKGFDVRGVFLKNWDLVDETGYCSAEQDWEDAQYVCDKLQIPIQRIDFVKQYWTDVFENTLREYQNGQTPNPDVYCNKYIKFGAFYRHIKENLVADAIATGHYARTSFGQFLEDIQPNQNVKLLRAVDPRKDQTFFLSQIPQDALRHTMFPVGSMLKSDVKRLAHQIGLESIAQKRESTGICFIGKRKFSDFISDYVDPQPGDFVNIETGEIVAKHRGIHNYTVGQKILLGGQKETLFSVRKMCDNRTILVAPGTNHPRLFSDLFYTEKPHWIDRSPFDGNAGVAKAEFRFQHGHRLVTCEFIETNERGGGLLVKLNSPVRAICAGQFAVFYDDNECLGSAKIRATGPWVRNTTNEEGIESETSDDETIQLSKTGKEESTMKEKKHPERDGEKVYKEEGAS
ncbi:mitochondrial tRNA-specific 2-thiouridylase 1-like [Sitodiplosis mosellana]|uniref:mitochondrial tRNA-specific 2-thiouridylase 1-like n=1 Tax=Sitodiplosis mosellana TaxID=263140 RepID=UPI0024453485|nr:mitochondrial tRNA-specific 2-thiouridylase 1-like [Sitodiplosis mosellana]